MVNGNPALPKDSNCHKCSQTLKPQLQKCFPEEVSEPLCRSGLPPEKSFQESLLRGGKGGGLDHVSRKIKRSFHNSRKIK